MNDLTGPEMDHKIALALGYKANPDGTWSRPPDKHGSIVSGPMAVMVPKFHKDLNAIWEARQNFTETEKASFQTHLVKLAGKVLEATARDHAEAFLRTKGLWPKVVKPELVKA